MSLDQYLAYPLEQIPYVLIALILAFSIHEWAHAYVAYRFGDPTAKDQGRLTLNPSKHVEPLGLIMIFLLGFGWARPVPVNRFHFRRPRLAGILVSIAGPLSNLVLAFLFMMVWYFLNDLGWLEWFSDKNYNMAYQLFNTVIYLNVVLFVFNLLPLPPLDGYRIIEDVVPPGTRAKMTQYENYGVVIFLVLAITPLGNYVFPPIFHTAIPFVLHTLSSFFT